MRRGAFPAYNFGGGLEDMGLKIGMIAPWGKNIRCGIRTYSEKLVNALAQLGVDVYIVRWPRFGFRSPELIESCVLDKIPNVDIIHHQCEYGLLTPNLEGILYSRLKQLAKPLVVTMHAVGSYAIDKVVGDVSEKVICHNEFCARHFQGDKSKVVIIAHGCSPQQTPPMDECKRVLGIDPRIPVVGYQGFISPPKGLETLIEAMTKVPNAALLIGGGWFVGEETDYIMRLKQYSLEALRGRCKWLGYVSDEQLPAVYGSFNILCYPSIHATESGALLTGLSHGRATLASAVPPFKEKEKLGALMTFKSVEDLKRKIKRLLKDEALRHKLEEGAKAYASKNSWSAVASKHLSLYQHILKMAS
jgi:glycosyltransferase involved in cell wall biosynthesis